MSAAARDKRSRFWPTAVGRSCAAINYSGGDQVVDPPCRGLHINADGTLVLVLAEDPEGFAGLPFVVKEGVEYAYAVRKIVQAGSSTATGNLIF